MARQSGGVERYTIRMQTARDWSHEERKLAIGRVVAHLVASRGITRKQAVVMLAARSGVSSNTVHGWLSTGDSRVPPPWGLIDLLRLESGMAKLTLLEKVRAPYPQ